MDRRLFLKLTGFAAAASALPALPAPAAPSRRVSRLRGRLPVRTPASRPTVTDSTG